MCALGEIDLGIEGNSEEKKQSPKKNILFLNLPRGLDMKRVYLCQSPEEEEHN